MTMDSINEILDAIIRGSLLGFLAGFWLMGLVATASTLKHLSIPGRFPSLSRYPAFAPTPRTVPNVEKKSGTNKAIRNGI